MIEFRDLSMKKRLREAYYEYLDDLARAGIIDHALNNAVLEGKRVEEHIVEVLRAAGRLPEGWDREQIWRIIAQPRVVNDSPVRKPDMANGHARLVRAYLPYAS
jgi:hypothetical protein